MMFYVFRVLHCAVANAVFTSDRLEYFQGGETNLCVLVISEPNLAQDTHQGFAGLSPGRITGEYPSTGEYPGSHDELVNFVSKARPKSSAALCAGQ